MGCAGPEFDSQRSHLPVRLRRAASCSVGGRSWVTPIARNSCNRWRNWHAIRATGGATGTQFVQPVAQSPVWSAPWLGLSFKRGNWTRTDAIVTKIGANRRSRPVKCDLLLGPDFDSNESRREPTQPRRKPTRTDAIASRAAARCSEQESRPKSLVGSDSVRSFRDVYRREKCSRRTLVGLEGTKAAAEGFR